VRLLSLLGFGVVTNTGSASVRINFTKKTKELNMAAGLKGTGGWLPEEGIFYPSHTSVFTTARIQAMCIELKEELAGFTAEERATLNERVDIFTSVVSISMIDVSRSWLKQWPRKVISMPADRLDGVRKAASWLMDAYRWLPPDAFDEDSKAFLKTNTPLMLISLEKGSLDPIKNTKGFDKYIS